jgi:hypothetical protein
MTEVQNRGHRNTNGLSRLFRKKPKPLWIVIVSHVLVLGIALVLYALPHHVIPQTQVAIGLKSERGAAIPVANIATPSPTPQVIEATPEPTQVAELVGNFRTKFADQFISGDPQFDENSYRSENVFVTFSSGEFMENTYNVADIYIADISYLVTAFAEDKYGKGYAEFPAEMAERFGSIATINGDYYGARDSGIVLRNGELYRDENNLNDMCVIYWDGTMKTFSPFHFDAKTEIANGAYQSWCFGPALLDGNGVALPSFNSTVIKANPRSVIGYYEPGHYCFVTVDGRNENSDGLDMHGLAQLMQELGCQNAYNLDGGQSSMLVKATQVVGNPDQGGRKVSDVIMILDGGLQ